MIFRIEREVVIGDDQIDINEWLEDSLSDSTRIESSLSRAAGNNCGFDKLYNTYTTLAGEHWRPRYAIDVIVITAGKGWKTILAMEYEGDSIMQQDWIVQIKDDMIAVQFKLMML